MEVVSAKRRDPNERPLTPMEREALRVQREAERFHQEQLEAIRSLNNESAEIWSAVSRRLGRE